MGDLISTLPDPILCHILSFLPTKQAVASSLLSKRWKPLWRSVPTLDFDYVYRSKEMDARFVQSVYAFILSRDQQQPLHKFRIRLWAGCTEEHEESEDPTNVTVWVNFAAQRQLQHLEICLFNHQIHPLPPPTIPPDIFTCTNLVVLKLHGLSLKPLSSVDFPFLKTMHLQTSLFIEYECLALLLSRCPLLQDFQALLLFFNHDLPDGIHGSFIPVQFFHIRQINHQVLHHHESTNRAFTMFRNLTHIDLDNIMCNKDWLNIVEMLKHCPRLQVLVINQQHNLIYETIQLEVDLRDWQCSQPVPECIQLHLKRCYLNDYRGTEGEFQFARYILQNGRVLESMTICSCPHVKQEEKHENLKKLSSCTRRSATCKLFFE